MTVQKIIHDPLSLSQPAAKAAASDRQAAQDLLDTLLAHRESPKILKRSGHYLAEEGCLSLPGERPADRYEEITVKYQDMDLEEHEQAFTGFVAETIQHEVDHCKGKLI